MPPKKADDMITKPRFDWSFNFGHILMVLTIAGGAITYIRSNERMQTQNDMRLQELEKKSATYIPIVDSLKSSNDLQNDRMKSLGESIRADRESVSESFKVIRLDMSDIQKNVANMRESNARMESTLNSLIRAKP